MKVTKCKKEIKLDVDVELSLKYKEKFDHQPKHCYDNAYQLLTMGLIDSYVIGWVIVGSGSEVPFPVRHGFGIKDGKIIDSTLHADMLPKTRYFTMIEMTSEDFYNLFLEYESKGKALHSCVQGHIGYNIENNIELELMKEMGIIPN